MMGKPKPNNDKSASTFEFPSTPLTPAQAESQRILSYMPDPDPIHGINYEWSMKDLQNWSKAEQELKAKAALAPNFEIKKPPKGPMTFGGRVWWSAAARFGSIIILFIGIISESLIILRDASVRITGLSMDGTGDTVEGAEEKRLRFARDLIILTRRQGDETTEQQGALENAPLTNPECQWVHDTDVQNNGTGIPLAVIYHMFTTLILAILVMAEFKIWTYRLHPSSTMNIGIIQLWAGLAGLSRSVNNILDIVAAYCLIVAGIGNTLSGFFDRWAAGGPGFMFFGTGIAPVKQITQNESSPIAMPPATVNPQKKGPIPPDPLKELLESEKLAGLSSARAEKAIDQTQPSPGSINSGITDIAANQPYSHHVYTSLPSSVPRSPAPPHGTPLPWNGLQQSGTTHQAQGYPYAAGIDMKPMLDYLASADPAAYRKLSKELKKREMEDKRSRRTTADDSSDDEEERPLRVHFSDSRKNQHRSSSSKAGKKWKNRMSHVL